MRPGLIVFAILCLAPGLANAAERMFSYDSDSPRAKALTGAGLTLTVDQGLLGGAKIKLIQATAVPVAVEVKAVQRRDEAALRDLLPEAAKRAVLYEVNQQAQQGDVLSNAFCPGAPRVWLAVSPIGFGKPMNVWALGEDGRAAKIMCAEMVFAWRGEWRTLPDRAAPGPVREKIGRSY